MAGLIYDTGMLLALDRGVQRAWRLHEQANATGGVPVLPVVVLAQAWRGGPQPRLRRDRQRRRCPRQQEPSRRPPTRRPSRTAQHNQNRTPQPLTQHPQEPRAQSPGLLFVLRNPSIRSDFGPT
jgi:hypothetical protein